MSSIDYHMFTCLWKSGIIEYMLKVSSGPVLNHSEVDIYKYGDHAVIYQTTQFICLVVYEFSIFMIGVKCDEFIFTILIKQIF